MARVTSSLFIAQSVEILSRVFIVRAKDIAHARKILAEKAKCRNCAWQIDPLIDLKCGQAKDTRK